MREADVAIRSTPPRQPDLVQRRADDGAHHLFYAAPEYLDGAPPFDGPDDLDRHRLVAHVAPTPYPRRCRA